tara:strand:+ start:555 stop:710 length:156 start_codon:yes stop_codon:yes gene_type:complete
MKCECPVWMSWLVLLAGVLYVLTDLGRITWWNLNWYSVAFLLWGLSAVMKK